MVTAKEIAKEYPVSLQQAKEFLKDYYSQKKKPLKMGEVTEGKYAKYSDLLMQKARLVAQGPAATKELKKLGYVKGEAKKVSAVMEKTSDFAMMSDGGNKKIARAVSKAKSEKELRAMIQKISKMAGGKYREADEDEVIMRAVNALDYGAQGTQKHADANVLVQLASIDDTGKDTDVRTDDMKKLKVKHTDAEKVYKALMSVKPALRDKYSRLLQKDIKSFKKTFDAVLKVAK